MYLPVPGIEPTSSEFLDECVTPYATVADKIYAKLKVLSKIFSELFQAESNLCGGDGGMIGFYESYACFHHYNTQRSNCNHLPEIDTTCNQGMPTSVWL